MNTKKVVNSIPFFFLASAIKTVGLRGTHSSNLSVKLPKMKVTVLPALSDNYMYLVRKKIYNTFFFR